MQLPTESKTTAKERTEMSERFKIVEMKRDKESWRVKFDAFSNEIGLGSSSVSVAAEEFQGREKGMHEFTPEEVADKARRLLANELHRMFKAAVISIPQADWNASRNLTVSEILRDLGLDDVS